MESAKDMIAIVGMISIAGLWGVCLVAGVVALWESLSAPIYDMVRRLKQWL